ncbi:beta-1,3-galactosyltransferase 5-like [Rhinoderma darwinii]|uniref:beta-1,3-galactosyltransferase 5-like n=1 Tax=Rhinoderma darwinii TaxID=43563 RepID=UPI003F66DD59
MRWKLLFFSFGLLILPLMILAGIYLLNGETNRRQLFSYLSPKEQRVHPGPTSYVLPLSRASVTLNDGVHVYHLNLSTFQEELPHLQNYQCSLILHPKRHEETSNSLIVLAIKSHPGSGSRREALRRTWAQEQQLDGYTLRPIFLLGQTDVSGQMEIAKTESQEFGDVLQWDFTEEHYNLSLKERCFLEWIFHQLPQVAFIFKGDDDEFVSPNALVHYIKTFASNPQVLHGCLQTHSFVMRSDKYRVSKFIFPGNIYPKFLSGGGFLFSGPSAKLLYAVSQKIPVFPLDDVYFGFLALAANLSFRHDDRFRVFGLEFEPCLYYRALVVHGVSEEQLVERWSKVQTSKCQMI